MFTYRYQIVSNILNKKDGVTQEDLDRIRDASDEELVEINRSLGIKIRSFYSLWNVKNLNCFEFKTERLLIHPYDFTLEVFKEVREKLNEEFYL